MIICFAAKTKGVMGSTSFEDLCKLFEETNKSIALLEELVLVLNDQNDSYRNLRPEVTLHDVRRYLVGGILHQLGFECLSQFSKNMCYKNSVLGEHVGAAEQYLKNIRRELNKLYSPGTSLNSYQSDVLLKQTKMALAELLLFGFEQFEIRSVLFERAKGQQVHSDVLFETSSYNEERCLQFYKTWIEKIEEYVFKQSVDGIV